jgi:excisionase family DNA binding protein
MALLITVAQAAKQFGMSKDFFYTRIQRNTVPHYRVGSDVRFDEAELREFFKKQPRPDGGKP